jgi:hypothetical protein
MSETRTSRSDVRTWTECFDGCRVARTSGMRSLIASGGWEVARGVITQVRRKGPERAMTSWTSAK